MQRARAALALDQTNDEVGDVEIAGAMFLGAGDV